MGLTALFLRGVLAAGLAAAGPAMAGTIEVGPLAFSDDLGGFVLHSVTGSGSTDDPFVVVEEITGDGPAVLTVRGLTAAFGNRAGTNHFVGIAVTKIVINGTDRPWTDFTMELQEVLGRESPYADGLSFGQGPDSPRPLSSDRYGRAAALDEPQDGVQFSDGNVAPGERVTFHFVITENSPTGELFLVQRRQEPIALLLPPSSSTPGG